MNLNSIGFVGGGRVGRILLGGWKKAAALLLALAALSSMERACSNSAGGCRETCRALLPARDGMPPPSGTNEATIHRDTSTPPATIRR